MAKRRFHEEYAGKAMSREMQGRDSGMISENKGAVANMPQEVMYKPWPKADHYLSGDLNDNIRGIDSQMDEDGREMKRHKQNNKW